MHWVPRDPNITLTLYKAKDIPKTINVFSKKKSCNYHIPLNTAYAVANKEFG